MDTDRLVVWTVLLARGTKTRIKGIFTGMTEGCGSADHIDGRI